VVQQLVRRIPDGHQVKREVDFILNQISDTMTPMHYHMREIIFVNYNKASLYLSTLVGIMYYVYRWGLLCLNL